MGYRFDLESANAIANLVFGRTEACYNELFSSRRSYESIMDFFSTFKHRYYSLQGNNTDRIIHDLIQRLEQIASNSSNHTRYKKRNNRLKPDAEVFNLLSKLGETLNRPKTKALLLPPVSTRFSKYDGFVTSYDTLQQLLRIHPGNTCLILQPVEQPKHAIIFDAFPGFDVALYQADMWPGVLFWKCADKPVFAPVRNIDDLISLFLAVNDEEALLSEIHRITNRIETTRHCIFQLSDLHFKADPSIIAAESRLESLVSLDLKKSELGHDVTFIITGDMLNSPEDVASEYYLRFENQLRLMNQGKMPIRVFGNHDINWHGLAINHKNQHLARLFGGYPKIEKIEEAKVILLLFNSNITGHLASGEIGEYQMFEMGNILDAVDNIEQYTLIAVLHHHLLPIPEPEDYEIRWYEKILSKEYKERSLRLNDADVFLEWLKRRHVKIVLHGHKHIPFFKENDGITIIGCGSSTGYVQHKKKGKSYLSYNILQIQKTKIICMIITERIPGSGINYHEKNDDKETTVRIEEIDL